MQRFVDWLTASRLRVMFGAALLAVLGYALFVVVWLPGALVVLVALRREERGVDLQAAAVAVVTLAWLLLSVGAGPVPAALTALALIVPPLLVGRLLARGGSLSLAFQFSTLAAVSMLVIVHLVIADPPGVWRPFVERLAADLERMRAMMSSAGSDWHPSSAELREVASVIVNWGVVAWVLLLNTIAAAALGLYAFGRQTQTPRLGPAFRELKAGRTLAAGALVMTLLSLTVNWDFATDVSRLFLGAFVLQGLALLHAAREMLGFSGGWLVATYALLFVPVAALCVESVLVVFGFLDNWLPLRGRLAALAAKGKGRRG